MGIKDFIENPAGCFVVNALVVAGVLVGIPVYLMDRANNYRKDLENKMLMKADSNGDGIVSGEEMAKVYNSLGFKLNEISPQPLNNSDIRRYLQDYSSEKEERK